MAAVVRSVRQVVVLVHLIQLAAPALQDITRTRKELVHNYRLTARVGIAKTIGAQLAEAATCQCRMVLVSQDLVVVAVIIKMVALAIPAPISIV